MKNILIISVIGQDKPGLVEQLAAVIAQQQGNWLESSFSRLAGQFAGIVKVAVNDKGAALLVALQALSGLDVRGVLDAEHGDAAISGVQSVALSLVGHDRIGIVKDVSTILARFSVNVEKLETWLDSAPMSGETMFHAQALLTAPIDVDLANVRRDLEAIADDLMVEWSE